MKNTNRLKQLLLGLAMLFVTNSNAQFVTTPATFGEFGSTDTPYRGIGVGNFPPGVITDAALHVNTNYMTPSFNYPGINFGEVFRTDCPSEVSTYWRMQRAGFEYGTIFHLQPNDDFTGTSTGEGFHFYIQASYFERDSRTYGDIRFNTGVVNPATSAGQPRMRIIGENGYVGIGDYTKFLPQNLLHLNIPNSSHGDVQNVYEQFTNGNNYTANSTDGFRVGITYNPITLMTDGELIQRQNSQIKFYTDIDNLTGAFPFNSPSDRMRIGREFRNVPGVGPARGDLYLTRVAITEGGNSIPGSATNWNGPNSSPLSLLHLGQAWSFNIGGHRSWMDVGTFTTVGSDVMYYGLKEESHGNNPPLWTDNMDGIIAWGDNIHPMDGADNLRFLFTASQIVSNGHAGNSNGVETARISSMTRMGIGNFTTPAFGNGSGIQPQRRLEIYDEHMLQIDATNNLAPAPQLRLTYTPSASITAGIWTDFQTTSLGDLYIHPYGWTTFPTGSVAIERYVGINTSSPGNTMEINSGITTPVATPARQIAGLRFTNLTNAVNPIVNPDAQKGILSVDNNGDVIFVTDEGSAATVTNANNGTSLAATTVQLGNVVGGTSASLLNSREIPMANFNLYFSDPSTGINGANNSIGIGTTSPVAKLDVNRVLSTTSVLQPIAVNIVSSDKSSSGVNSYALSSEVNGVSNSNNFGGSFTSKNAKINTSVQGLATQGLLSGANDENRASQFDAQKGRLNYGVMSNASDGETTYGIDITASNGTIRNYGSKAIVSASSTSSTAFNFGSYSEVSSVSTNTNSNFGAYMKASAVSGSTFGVYAQAINSTVIGTTCGVGGVASGGSINKAISGLASGWPHTGTVFNVGVYGSAPSNFSTPFPGALSGSYAGYFDGDVAVMATYWNPSDSNIKTNIQPIANVNSILDQINAYSYYFDTLQLKGIANVSANKQFGLLSQQVEAVAPNLVLNTSFPPVLDSLGKIIIPAKPLKMLNYLGIIPLLVEGHKEQKLLIDSLLARLANLESIVAYCCASRIVNPDNGQNETVQIKLVNIENSILYQNEPNPYTSTTTIRYFIPANATDMKITFQDASGKTIKEITLKETGQASILIDGNELINGIYTYSLVVSGRVLDSKKMVKIK